MSYGYKLYTEEHRKCLKGGGTFYSKQLGEERPHTCQGRTHRALQVQGTAGTNCPRERLPDTSDESEEAGASGKG